MINLAEREKAEDAYDARFQMVTLNCSCFHGWRNPPDFDVRCDVPGCKQGEIEVELCVNCNEDEHHCHCNVSDFMEAK